MENKFVTLKEETEMEGSYLIVTMEKVVAGPIKRLRDAAETAKFFRVVLDEPVWIVRVVIDAEAL